MITKFASNLPCGPQRFVALAKHHRDCIVEIRSRGLDAAVEYVETLGGVSQKRALARSIMNALARVPTFGATAYEIRNHTSEFMGTTTHQRLVWVSKVTWKFQGRRQVAALETMPSFGATIRSDTASRAARLP